MLVLAVSGHATDYIARESFQTEKGVLRAKYPIHKYRTNSSVVRVLTKCGQWNGTANTFFSLPT